MHPLRKLAIAFFVFAGLACGAQAEFTDVLKTPALTTGLAAQRPLNGIVALSSRLVAVGQRGHIIYSDDKGLTWKQAQVPVRSDLTAAFFSSDRAGWAVGHDGVVLHTEDGGLTWKLQFDGNRAAEVIRSMYARRAEEGDGEAKALLLDIERYFAGEADKPFLDVWFANDNEGFVVGAFNMIFHTADGGRNWEPWLERIENPRWLHLYAIHGQGDRVYIAGEQGFVAALDGRTRRFKSVVSPYGGSFFGVLPIDGGAVLFGMRGNAYRLDSGATWQKLDTGTVGGLTAATDLGEGRMALVSTTGDVLVGTASSGRFERLRSPRAMVFAGAAFVRSGKSLALVGSNGTVIVPLEQK